MLQQSVALTFGGGGSKSAWDDRELINAYDAAMDEFHASHPARYRADFTGTSPRTRILVRQGDGCSDSWCTLGRI
jgi:hypothetical protein